MPLTDVSVGLTVVGFAGSGLTAASESSRRAAASANHEVGGSAGAVGDVPANGFNTLLTRFAVTVAIGTALSAGEAGCAVMTAVGAAVSAFGTFDADDNADTGVVVLGAVIRRVEGTLGVTGGASTTTWLPATVVSLLTNELRDEDAPYRLVAECRGVMPPSAGPVPRLGSIDVLDVALSDDPRDPGKATVPGSDSGVSTFPSAFELVCAPPVPTVTPGPAEGLNLVDVGLLPDGDSAEVIVLDDNPVELDDPAELPVLDDEPGNPGEPFAAGLALDDVLEPSVDDPLESGAAHATPCPVKTAAPTPRATASPPTRPM